jgi:hypothetical protein
MAVPDILIGSKLDAKGFKQVESELSKLNKGVKNLAGAFGIALGARAMTTYAKNAVKAFAADEKASRSLALQLKNTGNAFAAPGVESYIANLQKTTAVLDDYLRPAFQTLLTATGDVALSQKALGIALDVSAGTGKSLSVVTTALSKGYLGQTTALSKLGVKLDKATLASGDMEKITQTLTDTYKGQALEAVKGYSGQMDLLAIAAADAKEIIGKGLLVALNNLGGNTGISETTKQMEGLAQFTADFIVGLSLIGKMKGSKTGILGMIGGTLADVVKYGPIGQIAAKGAASQTKPGYGSSNTLENFVAAGGKLVRVTNKLTAAQLLALQTANAKAKAEKDAASLEELKKKFDVERINLGAALANATTDEERARIASKIAILDGDAKAASSLNNLINTQIYAADQMLFLANAAAAASEGMTRYAENASVFVNQGKYRIEVPGGFLNGNTGGGDSNTNADIATNMPIGLTANQEIFNPNSGIFGPAGMFAPTNTNVIQISAGAITNEQGVVEAVQTALQELNARGWSQYKTGALP